jgi:DNA-binding NtrC family response regulator
VGAKQDVHSDARVVAATNEDLGVLIASGRFRPDLAHRVAGVTIRVPSLAERVDDIPLLAGYFLGRAGFGALQVTSGALDMLKRTAWPGNVRELKNFIEWAAIVARDELNEEAVARALSTRELHESAEGLAAEALDLRSLLTRHNWNKACVARELGVHRATIYRRMKRLQIEER